MKLEQVGSVHDITSAQDKAKEQEMGKQDNVPSESDKSNKNSWKARRARRAASKKRQNEKEQSTKEGQKQTIEPIPLNKEGEYYEGDDGNTTLPVEYAGHSIFAILDCGSGVAIATKKVWEIWGKPPLKQTCMKLQLADGNIEKPIGLLEKVIVTSCGVEYEHTFAVVDFGKSPNYDIILGRPFMRQLKMIQDWGSNYIYLRQQDAITRINVIDHSSREVARTPIADFKSTSSGDESPIPSWVHSRIHRWMNGASDDESADKMVFHDEDCSIVPIRTIQVISDSSSVSSEQSQENMISNSVESSSTVIA